MSWEYPYHLTLQTKKLRQTIFPGVLGTAKWQNQVWLEEGRVYSMCPSVSSSTGDTDQSLLQEVLSQQNRP